METEKIADQLEYGEEAKASWEALAAALKDQVREEFDR